MAEGRYYKLRFPSRHNTFDPQAYDDAAGLITSVATPAPKQVRVNTSKGDTVIAGLLADVLSANSVRPKQQRQTQKRILFVFDDKTQSAKALNILNKIKGDRITLSKVDFSGSYPKVYSDNGVLVPLVGYTQQKQQSGDAGSSSYGSSSEGSAEEPTGINPWIIVGASVAAAVIVIAVIIKLRKKK